MTDSIHRFNWIVFVQLEMVLWYCTWCCICVIILLTIIEFWKCAVYFIEFHSRSHHCLFLLLTWNRVKVNIWAIFINLHIWKLFGSCRFTSQRCKSLKGNNIIDKKSLNPSRKLMGVRDLKFHRISTQTEIIKVWWLFCFFKKGYGFAKFKAKVSYNFF